MLPVTRWNPGRYPPGSRFPQFGDGDAVTEVEEARKKLAEKRQVFAHFHLDRLQQTGLTPAHSVAHIQRPQGHEIEMQTENPTDDIGVQTDEYRPRNTQREGEGDEQDTGGGRGSRGNMASRATASALAGARHAGPIGTVAGAVAGSLVVAGGYVAGAITGMGVRGLKSAGGVVMNAITGPTDPSADADEATDAAPTPAPLAVGGGSSSSTGEPLPAFLQDRDPAVAKKSHYLDTPAISKERDRVRLQKQKAKDEADAKKAAAEATLRQHGIM